MAIGTKITHFFIGIIINIIILIGSSSILGYIFKIPGLYAWGNTPMAINTAVAFILIGISLFVLHNKTLG